MKKNVLFLLLCLICLVLVTSCNKDDLETATVPKTVKFMVISDIHYFDPSLFDLPANSYLQTYLISDRKLIIESSAILKKVLGAVLAEKPDFLLVPGDLTKDGEKIDHLAVAALFNSLSENGIRVLVIPGNHDINNTESYSYKGSSQTSIANVTPSEFASIYSNCGYENAVERDPASLSYVSEPVNGVWILGIDACHYTPKSETAGSISAGTLTWIQSVLTKAKKNNKMVLSMMHHGMLEHFPGQSTLFSEYVISDWDNKSTTLADLGMKVVFTGHFHAQDIVKKTTSSGSIFDVETGSTVTSPCPYRIVTLNTVDKTLKIESKKLEGVTYSTIPSETTFQQYARDYLNTGMKTISYYMLSTAPYSIPTAYITGLGLDQKMSNAFIAHYSGDETPSVSDNADIQVVVQAIPSLGAAMQSVWTDPAPADNNLTINL